MEDKRGREVVVEVLETIAKEVAKKAEGFQRKYGTLTAEDLAMTFTV